MDELPETTFIETIAEPRIRDVFRFWLEHRPYGGIPCKKDMNPARMPASALPNMFVYQIESDGRIRIVLMGTEAASLFRRDETGLYLEETLPEHSGSQRMAMISKVVEKGVPLYFSGKVVLATMEQRHISRLMLPVSSDGESVEHIFGIVVAGPILKNFHATQTRPIPDELTIVRYATAAELDANISDGVGLVAPVANPRNPLASCAPT